MCMRMAIVDQSHPFGGERTQCRQPPGQVSLSTGGIQRGSRIQSERLSIDAWEERLERGRPDSVTKKHSGPVKKPHSVTVFHGGSGENSCRRVERGFSNRAVVGEWNAHAFRYEG